jgi:hypothetical protein
MQFTPQVAAAVRKRHPFVLCYSCLAKSLALTEPDVRSAAQQLMLNGFTTELRACATCMRTDRLLVVKPDGDSETLQQTPPLFP